MEEGKPGEQKEQVQEINGEASEQKKKAKNPKSLLETVILNYSSRAIEICDRSGFNEMEASLSNLPDELKSKIFCDIADKLKRPDIFANQMLILFEEIKVTDVSVKDESELNDGAEKLDNKLMSFFNQFSYEAKLELLKNLVDSIRTLINIVTSRNTRELTIYPTTPDIKNKFDLVLYVISHINLIDLLLDFKDYISYAQYYDYVPKGPEDWQPESAEIDIAIQKIEEIKNLHIAIANRVRELVDLLIPQADQIKDFPSDVKEKANSIIEAFKLENSAVLEDYLKNLSIEEKEQIIEFLFLNYFLSNPCDGDFIKNLRYAIFPEHKRAECYARYHDFEIGDLESNSFFYFKILNKIAHYYPYLIETLYTNQILSAYDKRLYPVQSIFGSFLTNFCIMLSKLTTEKKYDQVVEKLFDLYGLSESLCIFKKALLKYYFEICYESPIIIIPEERSARALGRRNGFVECLKRLNVKIINPELNQQIDSFILSTENSLAY